MGYYEQRDRDIYYSRGKTSFYERGLGGNRMNEEEIACELRKKDIKLSKCRSKLQHLSFAFAINAYKNLDENDLQKFIKEEKKCLKLVNELKDFCAFYKIPVDFDKIYLLKEDREVVE